MTYLFIGGLQRSGTTLLGRLLAQHSEIAGLVNTGRPGGEGQFVQDVFPTDLGMGARRFRAGNTVRWAWHPEAHLTEVDLPKRPNAAQRLTDAWAPFWDKPGAPVLAEKTPANVMKTRFLQAAFPSASFVIITRNPIMQALAVRKWAPRTWRIGFGLSRIIDHWLTAMETFRIDSEHLDRVMVVSYEELMADPDAVLERVQRFLGVTLEKIDTSSVHERSNLYRDYWLRMSGKAPGTPFISTIPNRSPMSPVARALERVVVTAKGDGTARRIRERYAARIAQFGYSLDDVDTHTPVDWQADGPNEGKTRVS